MTRRVFDAESNTFPRARHWRALLLPSLALAAGLASALALGAEASDCPPARLDEYAIVRHVHDGDTLFLTDGRSVRLIGIDAPEVANPRRQQPEAPHAAPARDALRELLPPGAAVALEYDAERSDRYGRILAHLHRPPPRPLNVQARLLREGHALAIAVPPNLRHIGCYSQAERAARRHGAGLWARPDSAPLEAVGLGPVVSGFHRIRGRVKRVAPTRGTVWVDLEGGVSLRVPRPDLLHFRDHPLPPLEGRTVIARGWLIPRPGRSGGMIWFRHPQALEVEGGWPAPIEP